MASSGDQAPMDNPYWLAIVAPQPAYLVRIALFVALFTGTFLTVDWKVASSSAGTSLQGLSSPRQRTPGRSGLQAATTVCSSIHALGTSLAAIWVVAAQAAGDTSGFAVPLWQWALAFSQGYFLADAALYGVRRESWVVLHHGWMVLAHHPIGEPAHGCRLMGCGDCSRAVWLSATGYLAEVSTVFLSVRWFQHRWLRKHSAWYTVNSVCLLVTYAAGRLVTVPLILGGSLWPHRAEYSQAGLHSLVVFTSVTYTAMLLMSAFFLYTLVCKGLRRVLVFTPGEDKSS